MIVLEFLNFPGAFQYFNPIFIWLNKYCPDFIAEIIFILTKLVKTNNCSKSVLSSWKTFRMGDRKIMWTFIFLHIDIGGSFRIRDRRFFLIIIKSNLTQPNLIDALDLPNLIQRIARSLFFRSAISSRSLGQKVI